MTLDYWKRPERTLTPGDKVRIIGLRYGSLTEFRGEVRTMTQISRRLHIPRASVGRVVKNFEDLGKDLPGLVLKRKRHFLCIPAAIKKELLSQKLLQLWSPYSIVERVQLLKLPPFHCTISTNTLWRFY